MLAALAAVSLTWSGSVLVEATVNPKLDQGLVLMGAADERAGIEFDEGGRVVRAVGGTQRFEIRRAYSVPTDEPNGRLRVFRDTAAKRVRLYWGYDLHALGKVTPTWLELDPIPDALPRRVFVDAPAEVQVRRVPAREELPPARAFGVERRDFHWSGAFGEAVVISFPGRRERLAFWSAASWAPAWVLTDQYQVGYEFIETWGGGAPGCYEPMSDRAHLASEVTVTEDLPTHKTVVWKYALLNPDYVPWGSLHGGKQLAEAEEVWTVTPDAQAQVVRRFFPCLDSSLRQHSLGFQVAEMDATWGSRSVPEDWMSPQTVTALGPDGRRFEVRWPNDPARPSSRVSDWPWLALVVHSVRPAVPDVFMAVESQPGLDCSLDWQSDWHRERWWRFSHYPFNLQPFQYETNSQTEGRGSITHSSLVYVGDSSGRFPHTDSRGRRYAEWRLRAGLAGHRDEPELRRRLSAWFGE